MKSADVVKIMVTHRPCPPTNTHGPCQRFLMRTHAHGRARARDHTHTRPVVQSIAALHTIGHFGAVLSMNAGAVSFTHIVKAAEPVFSTVLSGIILGTWAPAVVNLTLVPVMAGVIMASFGGLEFNWAAFAGKSLNRRRPASTLSWRLCTRSSTRRRRIVTAPHTPAGRDSFFQAPWSAIWRLRFVPST